MTKRRRISHGEVKRILNEPEITHPSEDDPDRMVARGHLDDGRRGGVVYTEQQNRDADVLVNRARLRVRRARGWLMRIEYDREANAVYLHVAEGEHARTVEVEPLINLR